MADTYTTNLNLTKPEPGAAEDTWGISLNSDLDTLDAIFSSSGTQVNLNPNQVNFADNKKAIFGTGSDLSIYHSGTGSYIDDSGDGSLYIRANNLYLQKYTGETYLAGVSDSSVYLYYNGLEKLRTLTGGIDVTGTVTSDGLTVDGTTFNFNKTTSGLGGIYFNDASNNGSAVLSNGSNAQALRLWTDRTDASNFGYLEVVDGASAKRLLLVDDSGDISFYDDTGSTQGLFWDASAESLGIGTTSPSSTLHLRDTAAQIKINSDNGQSAYLTFGDANDGTRGGLEYTSTDDLKFQTNNMVDQMVIRYTGDVGIGTVSPSEKLTLRSTQFDTTHISIGDSVERLRIGYLHAGGLASSTSASQIGSDSSSDLSIAAPSNAASEIKFFTNTASGTPSEALRIDSSQNLLVGKTSSSGNTVGAELRSNGGIFGTKDGAYVARFNRLTDDGSIVEFQKDGTTVGSIASKDGDMTIGTGDTGLRFNDTYDAIYGANSTTQAGRDASIDLGMSTQRFKDIYATNGTIQTSDINEKQDIEDLLEAETRVAVAAKGLLKKYRWKSAVADKGDDARIHFGIMAQDLQQAFSAEGLDAGDYGMFISTTWTDETTGEEKTRLGVRYNELLAFIIAAI